METIRELQKQLAAAQAVSNASRISERNCIDLVQKLIQKEHVKLIHTTSGKEWLTPEQLDREIKDALAMGGGRLNVMELALEVGVDISHCDARVEVLRNKDSSFTKLRGELLSGQYMQNVASEIEDNLEEAGCLSVSDLATRYALPAEVLRDSVLEAVTKSTSHIVKQNTIYTSGHASRVEARVRGALRGCTQPVSLAQLATRHSLDPDMVSTSAQKIVKEGLVQGKVHAYTFTPKGFSEGQASRVDTFFATNGYLPLSLAKTAGVVVKDWARGKSVEGITLTSVFMASHLVDAALSPISEALNSESWIDVQPLLPETFTMGDAQDFLQHLANKKRLPTSALVLGHVVVSRAFVASLAKTFEAEVAKAADGGSKAGSGGKKKAGASAPAHDDDDDDGGSKKKGKKGAKGKKAKGGDEEEGPGAASAESGIDNQTLCDSIAEKQPELPCEVYDELCGHLQPILAAMILEKQTALRSSLQTKQRAIFEQAEKLVQERYETLVLGVKALQTTKMLDSPLYPFLLREVVAEPLHRLLAYRLDEATGTTVEVTTANRKQCLDKLIAKEGTAKTESLSKLAATFNTKGGGKEDAKEAKEGGKAKEGGREAKEAKDAGKKAGKKKDKGGKNENDEDGGAGAGEGEAADVAELYHVAAGDCHIFCRKVDKRREKSALQELRVATRERLKDEACSDPLQICWLGLQAASHHDGVPGLLFPRELWAFRLVMQTLQPEETREKATALCDLIEKGEDKVALESAVSEWRRRSLGTSSGPAAVASA